MKRNKLVLLCISAAVLLAGVTAIIGNSSFLKADLNVAENGDYKVTLDSTCQPAGIAGSTASATVNLSGVRAANPNIPFDYTKVYESSTGHVSIGAGGNIACSTLAATNIDSIKSVKVSFTSGGALLRYGINGEIHQIHIASGTTYNIAGNWFMVRNESNSAVCENVTIEVQYPCNKTEFACPDNTYFDETFEDENTSKEHACFDSFGTVSKYTALNIADGAATVDFGGVNYDNQMNTYGKFTGAYSYSVRVKFNSANTTRLMMYIGKSVYSATYTQITADTSKGTSIEINTAGWIRANGVDLVNVNLTAPTTDYSVFTVNVDSSHHFKVLQDGVIKATFEEKTYTTDGFASLGCGTGGESKLVVDGVRTEAAAGGDFNYANFKNTIGNNLLLANRGGSAYAKVSDGAIKTYLNNDNLYTVGTYQNVEVELSFKNPDKGRIEVVFGDTSPTNTGYGEGGNMGTGKVGVIIADTFVRYFDNSTKNMDTTGLNFPTKTEFVNVKITLNGTSLTIAVNGSVAKQATITGISKAGQIVFTRGTGAAEIQIGSLKVTNIVE